MNSNSINPTSFLPSNKSNKTIWLLGDTITLKVTGDETDGKYSVWEIRVPSQSGPPSHYHSNLEEGFYVLEGNFSFQYNENIVNVASGSFVHVSRGAVHTYKNVGSNAGKLLVIGIPAGFENFVEELGIHITDESNFTPPSTPFDIDKFLKYQGNMVLHMFLL
jgi:quercetin dioxygenase-like cupin family protein